MLLRKIVLPLSQIIRRFGYTISRYVAKVMYLEKAKRLIIWDGGSNILTQASMLPAAASLPN